MRLLQAIKKNAFDLHTLLYAHHIQWLILKLSICPCYKPRSCQKSQIMVLLSNIASRPTHNIVGLTTFLSQQHCCYHTALLLENSEVTWLIVYISGFPEEAASTSACLSQKILLRTTDMWSGYKILCRACMAWYIRSVSTHPNNTRVHTGRACYTATLCQDQSGNTTALPHRTDLIRNKTDFTNGKGHLEWGECCSTEANSVVCVAYGPHSPAGLADSFG